MKTLTVLDDQMYPWYKDQIDAGRTEIHQASRPLMGEVMEDTWDLPCFWGRHGAAFNPDSPEAPRYRKINEANDAAVIRFVTEQQAFNAGVAWYTTRYRGKDTILCRLYEEQYREHIVEQGCAHYDEV